MTTASPKVVQLFPVEPLDPLLIALRCAIASKPQWTHEDVAQHCGVSVRAVYRWLSGAASVNVAAVLSAPPGFVRVFLDAYLSEAHPTLGVCLVNEVANDNWRKAA